jgi:hypothetical protein
MSGNLSYIVAKTQKLAKLNLNEDNNLRNFYGLRSLELYA